MSTINAPVAATGRDLNVAVEDARKGIDRIVDVSGGYVVVRGDGERFRVDNDLSACTCGECQPLRQVRTAADVRDADGPAVSIGTPPQGRRATRRRAQCIHATAVENALDRGTCPTCGHNVHRKKEYADTADRVVMVERLCTSCDTTLDSP